MPESAGPPALTRLGVLCLSSHIERATTLLGLEEQLVVEVLDEVLRRGKLSPRVLDLFRATEHEAVLQQISALNVQQLPPILPTTRNRWLGDKPKYYWRVIIRSHDTPEQASSTELARFSRAASPSGQQQQPQSLHFFGCPQRQLSCVVVRKASSTSQRLLTVAIDKNAVRKKPPALGLSIQSSRLRKQLLSKTWPAPRRKQESYDEHPKHEPSGTPPRKSKRETRPTALSAAPVPAGDLLAMDLSFCLLPAAAMEELARACDLTANWHDKASLLWYMDLSQADIKRLARVDYMSIFNLRTTTLQSRLRFLRDQVGLTMLQLKLVLRRQATSLTYTTEHWSSHIAYFNSLGVDAKAIPQMIGKAPQVFAGLSLEDSIKPRVANLLSAVAVDCKGLHKVLTRCPILLAYPEETLRERMAVLLKAGISADAIGKMVQRHPLVLLYSSAVVQERLDYLFGLGVDRARIAGMVARLPQLLALDVHRNLAPKVRYLLTHLRGNAAMLASNPAYLTLSLNHRIMPRHQFLRHTGALALNQGICISPALLVGDEQFAVAVAKSSLPEYLAFREGARQWDDHCGKALKLARLMTTAELEVISHRRACVLLQ